MINSQGNILLHIKLDLEQDFPNIQKGNYSFKFGIAPEAIILFKLTLSQERLMLILSFLISQIATHSEKLKPCMEKTSILTQKILIQEVEDHSNNLLQ